MATAPELKLELVRSEERLAAAERLVADREVTIAELRRELAELANVRERAAVAEAVIEAERMAGEDRVAARNAVIEELRTMLAEARRPWWRRWLGERERG